MDQRIKLIRNELKMTQTEFGARIGVKGNTITGYETGLRNPSDAVIFSICREFNVKEQWLRTGEGEMFDQVPEEDEVAAYVAELLVDEENSLYTIIKEIMHTYNELDKKSQEVIKDCCNKFLENLSRKKEG